MPKRDIGATAYWRSLLAAAAWLLLWSQATLVRADTPEEEGYKLYKALISQTLGKDIDPCKYPLHLVFMLDTAEGMRGTAQADVQWALTKIGAEFLTANDRLTLYNFDAEVHLAPGEVKTFKDEERFGGQLNALLVKGKKPAPDIYYRAKSELLRQANLFRESDKSHLIVAIMITHKIYGVNGVTVQGTDRRFEQPYRDELKRFVKGDGDMLREGISRKGENQPEIKYDVLWAVEGGAKSKQRDIPERYRLRPANWNLPAPAEKTSPKYALYALMLLCAGAMAGCYWYVRKRLKSPIVIKTSLRRSQLQSAITWERREIRIYACETSAAPKSPNDIYLPTCIKEPGDALTPKHLLTLSLSEGVMGITGRWSLTKAHPEVSLVAEAKHIDYTSVTLPHQKKTRLYLELRNGVEVEMDFTPGREANSTFFNIVLVAVISAALLFFFLTLSQQSEPHSEPIPLPSKENVCQ